MIYKAPKSQKESGCMSKNKEYCSCLAKLARPLVTLSMTVFLTGTLQHGGSMLYQSGTLLCSGFVTLYFKWRGNKNSCKMYFRI